MKLSDCKQWQLVSPQLIIGSITAKKISRMSDTWCKKGTSIRTYGQFEHCLHVTLGITCSLPFNFQDCQIKMFSTVKHWLSRKQIRRWLQNIQYARQDAPTESKPQWVSNILANPSTKRSITKNVHNFCLRKTTKIQYKLCTWRHLWLSICASLGGKILTTKC